MMNEQNLPNRILGFERDGTVLIDDRGKVVLDCSKFGNIKELLSKIEQFLVENCWGLVSL